MNKNIFLPYNYKDPSNQDDEMTYKDFVKNLTSRTTKKKDCIYKFNNKIECRWRIMDFDANRDKFSIEISYKKPFSKRMYLNIHGYWVLRDIPKYYNKFVKEIYYYYE